MFQLVDSLSCIYLHIQVLFSLFYMVNSGPDSVRVVTLQSNNSLIIDTNRAVVLMLVSLLRSTSTR